MTSTCSIAFPLSPFKNLLFTGTQNLGSDQVAFVQLIEPEETFRRRVEPGANPIKNRRRVLQIAEQSKQLHESSMSRGDGNNPVFCWQIRSITPFEKCPCRSATKESMAEIRVQSVTLFISHRHHGIDLHGSSRRQIAGQQRHHNQQCASREECRWIVGSKAKE